MRVALTERDVEDLNKTQEVPITQSNVTHIELRRALDLQLALNEARELLLIGVELIVKHTTLPLTDGVSGEFIEQVAQFLDRTA